MMRNWMRLPAVLALCAFSWAAQAVSPNIVVSQVYGGAGCGTAGCSTFKNDYIELFNRAAVPVNIAGWSLQYAAAGGTTWQVTALPAVDIEPGRYLLVAMAGGANGVNDLPAPDVTGAIAMSATTGKVALVNTLTALSGACPGAASIVDFVGFGGTASCNEGGSNAPAPSTVTAILRAAGGCTDTDSNSQDFAAAAPSPRNSASPAATCGTAPALSISDVTLDEGDAGTTSFEFTVSLSAAAGAGGVSFDIATADGTAHDGVPAGEDGDYLARSLTGQTIPAGSNSYTFAVTVNGDTAVEGDETFFVNVTNISGAIALDAQGQGTIRNDDTLAAPTVVAPADGAITSNSLPMVAGTAVPGVTVEVYFDGTLAGSTQVGGSGNWTYAAAVMLADGPHTVHAKAMDGLGNSSADSNVNTFQVDTVAPPAPVVVAPANGSVTSAGAPTFSGTAEAASTVTLFVDGTASGSTMTDASGNWSHSASTPLADGAHTVRARSTDSAGNTSADSNTNTFIVDTTAPAAPVVATPPDGAIINTGTPAFTGTAEAGSTVTVVIDGAAAGTAPANGAGGWSFVPASPLADGSHTVRARSTDGVGNTGPDSSTHSFTVDTTAPAAPVITMPADGSTTSDNTPPVSGTSEAGATIAVYLDGALAGSVGADASGNWSYLMATPLADGIHSVAATASDAAGNTSTLSADTVFHVDTVPPAAPILLAPADGSSTADTTPTVSGTAEADALVTVLVDGAGAGTTSASAAGAWSLDVGPLADGVHVVVAIATDGAGLASAPSIAHSFTVDTSGPAAPVLLAPADGSGGNHGTPTVSGTAEAAATVTVLVNGASAGTTTADGAGHWSLGIGPLADGVHTVAATAADALGHTSPMSNVTTFSVDTTAPSAPVLSTPSDGSTHADATPTIAGTAEAASTVSVRIDGAMVGTTTADGAGNWSFTPVVALADGVHTAAATATDAAGNTGPASNLNSFTVDTTAPGAPVVTTPAEGGLTSDTTPRFSGTAEPGSTVTVRVDGAVVGTTTTNAGGAWWLEPVQALASGPHSVTATATDAAGNTGPASAAVTFRIAGAAPLAAPVMVPVDAGWALGLLVLAIGLAVARASRRG